MDNFIEDSNKIVKFSINQSATTADNFIKSATNFLDVLVANILTIVDAPTTIFALIGVLALVFMFIYIRRIKITTRTLIYISLMLALTILLNQFKLYHMPQGGSVTLGAMVPLLIISYRFGIGIGALAGFLYGLINMLQDPFILHPIQVLFDYPLPYMAMGLAALLPEHRLISAGIAFITRFACHFISGVIFFSSYAPEGMSPIIYSIVFNASYLIPETIICCVILKFLPLDRLIKAMRQD